MYDFTAVISSIGGGIGIFLGYSCFGVALTALQNLHRLYERRIVNSLFPSLFFPQFFYGTKYKVIELQIFHLFAWLRQNELIIKDETLEKGEMVIVIEGSKEKQPILVEHEKVLFEEIQKLSDECEKLGPY